MESSDYKIAIICALPVELAAAEGMLDAVNNDLPRQPHDYNTYRYGRIGKHNVVLACLPSGVIGTSSTATLAAHVLRSFPNLSVGLIVGIGGGVSDMESSGEHDVRMGDVVVSRPTSTFGGVVQYDMGKNRGEDEFQRTGMLNGPPSMFLTAIATLEAKHMRVESDAASLMSEMLRKFPRMRVMYSYQGEEKDLLFEASYEHEGENRTCANCDPSRLVHRPPRVSEAPSIHYGVIASGNQVIRHGVTRDKISRQFGALCLEMEAAGLMNSLPCLVIRGVCDYADSHKNKMWQPYAAAAAAAYAKELLLIVPTEDTAPIRMRSDYLEGHASGRSTSEAEGTDRSREKSPIPRSDMENLTSTDMDKHSTAMNTPPSYITLPQQLPPKVPLKETQSFPRFYFSIREMRPAPNKDGRDSKGLWYPPSAKGHNKAWPWIGSAVTGHYFLCDFHGISDVDAMLWSKIESATSSHYRTTSLYHNHDVFYGVDYNAILIGVGLLNGFGMEWGPLKFLQWDNDTSYVTLKGGNQARLRMQPRDKIWPNVILPRIYHAWPNSSTQGPRGSMIGDLSLIIALLALSIQPQAVPLALKRWFVDGQWKVTNDFVPGRESKPPILDYYRGSGVELNLNTGTDRRGVVVSVYAAPETSPEQLKSYEVGKFGPMFP